IVRHYRAMTALVGARGKADPDIEVRYASTVRGWENTMKNYQGQLEGFARIDALARKRAEEEAVLAWLAGQGEAGEAALEAHRRRARPGAADARRHGRAVGGDLALPPGDRAREARRRTRAGLPGTRPAHDRGRPAADGAPLRGRDGPRTAALLAGRIPEAAARAAPAGARRVAGRRRRRRDRGRPGETVQDPHRRHRGAHGLVRSRAQGARGQPRSGARLCGG